MDLPSIDASLKCRQRASSTTSAATSRPSGVSSLSLDESARNPRGSGRPKPIAWASPLPAAQWTVASTDPVACGAA